MDFLEEMVMWNLCARYPSELFFCPQYDVGSNWSCPDFVILYPKERQVWVVEVSGAANATALARKVVDREKQWIQPLREGFKIAVPMAAEWRILIQVFIRTDAEPGFRRAFGSDSDEVRINTLEGIGFAWSEWGKKLKTLSGKPRD